MPSPHEPAGGFTTDVSTRSGWVVLSVTGDVDLYTVPRLRQRLQELIAACATATDNGPTAATGVSTLSSASDLAGAISAGAPGVVLDLRAVAFMDSAGLGVLVAGHKQARSRGRQLRLAGLDPRVQKLLDITGLGRVLAVYPDLDHAVAPAAPAMSAEVLGPTVPTSPTASTGVVAGLVAVPAAVEPDAPALPATPSAPLDPTVP